MNGYVYQEEDSCVRCICPPSPLNKLVSHSCTGAVTYIVQERPASESSSVMLSAFGAPTGLGGDSFSTMDFSMPSYSDGVTSTTTAPKADVPAFNPFEREAADDGDKAAEKAAAAERKAAEKAAKVAEKAAAEQAKAAEKAALEQAKADKAARRAAELQKQKEAVTRAAKKEEAVCIFRTLLFVMITLILVLTFFESFYVGTPSLLRQ